MKKFFSIFVSKILWLNILAMVLVAIGIVWFTFYQLNRYTMHNEAVPVPDLSNMDEAEALRALSAKGLKGETIDRIFKEQMQEGLVVEQRPAAQARVKRGRTIYLTLSSSNRPTIKLPDLIDNSSLREGEARLQGAGFKLAPGIRVKGEKDWIYGILHGSDTLHTGDAVAMGATLTLLIGSGEEEDSTPEETEATVDESWFE